MEISNGYYWRGEQNLFIIFPINSYEEISGDKVEKVDKNQVMF